MEGSDFPGFVDLQINGWDGIDFSSSDLSREDACRACDAILKTGTTAFLATIITQKPEVIQRNIGILAALSREQDYRNRLLGIHLEGPFLCPEDGYRGAHKRDWILPPDPVLLERFADRAGGALKLVTLSAGLDASEDLIRTARKLDMRVSLGHQKVTKDILASAVKAGASCLTHLGNGVPHSLERHSNSLLAGLAEDRLTAMIIPDGHHLPEAWLKIILRTKGLSRTIAVSDASPVAGIPAGDYSVFGAPARLSEDGKLFNPETGYLAGSAASLTNCMNVLLSWRSRLLRDGSIEEPVAVSPGNSGKKMKGDADRMLQQAVTKKDGEPEALPAALALCRALGLDNPLRFLDLDPSDLRPIRPLSFDEENGRFLPRNG